MGGCSSGRRGNVRLSCGFFVIGGEGVTFQIAYAQRELGAVYGQDII